MALEPQDCVRSAVCSLSYFILMCQPTKGSGGDTLSWLLVAPARDERPRGAGHGAALARGAGSTVLGTAA